MNQFSLSNSTITTVLYISRSNVVVSDSLVYFLKLEQFSIVESNSNVTFKETDFSSLSAATFCVLRESSYTMEFVYFTNIRINSVLSLNYSSANLLNSSFVVVESSESIIVAHDSKIVIQLVDVSDVVFANFVSLVSSTLVLEDTVLSSNITSLQSFLIGSYDVVQFKDLGVHSLFTPSNHPLLKLNNSKFYGDRLSFELLTCCLFEFTTTQIQMLNTSFSSINSSTLGHVLDSSLVLTSSDFFNLLVNDHGTLISFVNSYFSFNNVSLASIKASSIFTVEDSEAKFNISSFSEIVSIYAFQFSSSSSCSMENTVISDGLNDVTFLFKTRPSIYSIQR
ncbi:hypothetical protein GEMRC1_003803 [Eukaryota sp. GEM-RC1]